TLAADGPAPTKLGPEERKKLLAEWNELVEAGIGQRRKDQAAAALESFTKALEIAGRLYPKEEFPQGHPDLAICMNFLGLAYQEQGNYARAEDLFRKALAMRQQLFPGDHRAVVLSLGNLGAVLYDQGKYAAAEAPYRAAVE